MEVSQIPSLPPLPSLNNTLGALFVGLVLSTALFGLTTMQTYIYFVNYPSDQTLLKWFVGVLWTLDFTHTFLISHAAYHFFILEYRHILGLNQGEWSIIVEVGVTTAVTFLVQCFLAYRLHRLNKGNWFLTGCILLLALGHVGLGTASTVRLFQIGQFSRLPEISNILSSTLIVMAVNDTVITASLCYYLHKTQKQAIRNGSKRHDAVRLLILYTIETGLLTSVIGAIDAAFALAMPKNWIFIALEFLLAKLYVNSLLTILNSRNSIRNKFGGPPSTIPSHEDQRISLPLGDRISESYSIRLHTLKTEQIDPKEAQAV